ncbi:MAG TPA: potassium-transporting ATPase subunit KdpB [Caldisericia bacterium]|nr:MAG: Potassium-transporting ATPase B chain [bacterium ADurb.Bin132]HNW31148.1 potassium-transporting ATPase subunit KdpB [Caldisericia bacterium]HNY61935.1 potassium-transporting ATPase subunit KdpB [Caldisericia bacterium]HOC80032.1 potassium-transporting ATPase subunit KdpB [Caldisericia bacterium]HOG71002.1 potassium-transporting ATPase subunit KdpB [Caldisericia bacterium]
MAKKSLFTGEIVKTAILGSFVRLNPASLWRNPVMLIVFVVSSIVTVQMFYLAVTGQSFGFELQISIWLWFTVLFANFAEALAEGRGNAQAQSLRTNRSNTIANKIEHDGSIKTVSATTLKKDDIVIVSEGEIIPSDGDIVHGVALIDESAITGESAPVVRESGGDRCGVTGGTRVLSGKLEIRITAGQGETFIDHMISMVEGAKRMKTPNEIALEILLIALTSVFLCVTVTLPVFSNFFGTQIPVVILASLLVCLMPTTIGGLLPAIGIAGMDRLLSRNVIALSGRAVEASGDVDVVLLDKTGTITLGNRQAVELIPVDGVDERHLFRCALLSSLADDTPEGRSILSLSKEKLGIKGRDIKAPELATFVPYTAENRMSGIDVEGRKIRKGAFDAIEQFVHSLGGSIPNKARIAVDSIAKNGGTPLVVSEGPDVIGVVNLKDILKENIGHRLSQLRKLGIVSVMITGDNPLTAAAIAAEAGIDDFIAQARPETKLASIKKYQEDGHLVAMIGDGTNDAPALAQADVGVAMNAGTQSAREAANMVDLDSNPSKLLDIVETGKQILITRGALTTFSIANDVAKYFAIIPAIFAATFPELGILNIMHLATPHSAILSSVIFNAIIIPTLIPLALKGISYKAMTAQKMLLVNIFVFGLGGLLLPFVSIKLIDMIVVALGLV